jgi:hypothetical protein
MPLSDVIARNDEPGTYNLTIFVGGDGQSFRRDLTIGTGTPVVAQDLAGVTCSAEIRSATDELVALITTTVTDAATGAIRLTMTRAQCDAIAWPATGQIAGKRAFRGRWHLRLDDGTVSIPVLAGDVEVIR